MIVLEGVEHLKRNNLNDFTKCIEANDQVSVTGALNDGLGIFR